MNGRCESERKRAVGLGLYTVCRRRCNLYGISSQSSCAATVRALSLMQSVFSRCRRAHASVAPQDSLQIVFLIPCWNDSSPGSLLHITLTQHTEQLQLKYSILHLYRDSHPFLSVSLEHAWLWTKRINLVLRRLHTSARNKNGSLKAAAAAVELLQFHFWGFVGLKHSWNK